MKCASISPAMRHGCARVSLIDETDERYVRMAHLATVGSHQSTVLPACTRSC